MAHFDLIFKIKTTRFLYSRVALSNPYSNTCVQCREAVCTISMMVFGMTRPGHKPCERGTRKPLSQPDAVFMCLSRFGLVVVFQLSGNRSL